LDMGAPVKILDLAVRMITLSGLKPYEDVDIVFTEPRPGEKLFEELDTDEEHIEKTRHPKIFIGRITPCSPHVLQAGLADVAEACRASDARGLRACLSSLLPESRLGMQIPRSVSEVPPRPLIETGTRAATVPAEVPASG